MQRLIDEWLVDTDMALFSHTTRDCYFDEAKECIRLELDDRETITQQMIRYKDIPRHLGLYQGGVILRKHTNKVARFNEVWWTEYCLGAKRDQLSLPIALFNTGLAVNGVIGDAFHHQWFELVAHNKLSEWAGKV